MLDGRNGVDVDTCVWNSTLGVPCKTFPFILRSLNESTRLFDSVEVGVVQSVNVSDPIVWNIPVTNSLSLYGAMGGVELAGTFSLSAMNASLMVKFTNFSKLQLKLNDMSRVEITDSMIKELNVDMVTFVNISNTRLFQSKIRVLHYSHILISNTDVKWSLIYLRPRTNTAATIDNLSLTYSMLIAEHSLIYPQDDNTIRISNCNSYMSTIYIFEWNRVQVSYSEFRGNLPYQNYYFNDVLSAFLSNSTITIVAISRCDTVFTECIFSETKQTGALFVSGIGTSANLVNCKFTDNESSVGGSAIHFKAAYYLSIQQSQFFNNRQTLPITTENADQLFGGGAVYVYQGMIYTRSCTFLNNTSTNYGGAIFAHSSLKVLSVDDVFYFNTAKYGGAIASRSSVITSQLGLINGTITNNNADLFGGGVFGMKTKLDLINSTIITSNNAYQGGGIYLASGGFMSYTYLSDGTSIPAISSVLGNTASSNSDLNDMASFPSTINLTLVSGNLEVANNSIFTSFGDNLHYSILMKDMFGHTISLDDKLFQIDTVDDDSLYSELFRETGGYFTIVTYSFKDSDLLKKGLPSAPVKVSIKLKLNNLIDQTASTDLIFKQCGTLYSLERVREEPISGKVLVQCQFNPNYMALFIVLGIVFVSVPIVAVIVLVFAKMKTYVTKAKAFNQKEKAELDLKQKLIDLQELYSDELEKKHSFKNWLIKVEDLEVIRKIGEGSFGLIYQARWKNVYVALKTVKMEDTNLDSNDFEHEASMLSSIRHPNCVSFYGVCLAENNRFLVTEYMSAGSLDNLLYDCKMKKKHLTVQQKLHLLCDIASGMSYLHNDRDGKMIIHRDLKPGNILLASDLTAKVCDFGLSKLSSQLDSNTRTSLVGSMYYMAPEVLLGEHYNEKCDVFSFSLIMWQVLFEEVHLFHPSYCTNEKYTSVMPEEEVQKYATINDSPVLIPRKVCEEGLRLPIPKLPIQPSSEIGNWTQVYFIPPETILYGTSASLMTHVRVLNDFFLLLVKCWSRDPDVRPSFSEIFTELNRLERTL